MRKAMAEAEVGDDVHSEAPTVRSLEEHPAARTGKEATLAAHPVSPGRRPVRR